MSIVDFVTSSSLIHFPFDFFALIAMFSIPGTLVLHATPHLISSGSSFALE